MADVSAQEPTQHEVDPSLRERPEAPRPTPRRDPLEEVADALLTDAREEPAEHNRAWRIPGGGE